MPQERVEWATRDEKARTSMRILVRAETCLYEAVVSLGLSAAVIMEVGLR